LKTKTNIKYFVIYDHSFY